MSVGLAFAVSVGNAKGQDEAADPLEQDLPGVFISAGEAAPFAGLLITEEEQESLNGILRDLETDAVHERGRANVLQARLDEALARLNLAQDQITLEGKRFLVCQAEVALEKARRRSWLENHFGGCAGIGFYYDPATERSGFAVQATTGFKF